MTLSIFFFFGAVVPSVVNAVSPDGQGKSDNPPTRGKKGFNVKLMVFSSGKIELIFFRNILLIILNSTQVRAFEIFLLLNPWLHLKA